MDSGVLGKRYEDGEVIIREGDVGDCMYVIQSGEVEIVKDCSGKQVPVAIRRQGDFVGEMAVFNHEVRKATVRARGPVQVLTVDRKNLLRRIQGDPSLAFRIIETMSERIQELSDGVAYLGQAANPPMNRT